jgi:hypothetical protein
MWTIQVGSVGASSTTTARPCLIIIRITNNHTHSCNHKLAKKRVAFHELFRLREKLKNDILIKSRMMKTHDPNSAIYPTKQAGAEASL